MTSRCKELDVDSALPGMVLAAPILDLHGGMLLPDASILTDAILASLRRRGIETVVVIDDDVSEEEMEAERERIRNRLERLFRRCQSESGSGLLRRAIEEYRMRGDL